MAIQPQPGCGDVRPIPSPRDISVSSAPPALPGAAHALFGPSLSWQFCALAALDKPEDRPPSARSNNHPAAPPLGGVAAGSAGGQIPAAPRRRSRAPTIGTPAGGTPARRRRVAPVTHSSRSTRGGNPS